VSGTVLDAHTRAPIKGAKVIQSEGNGIPPGKTRSRTTDAAGRFRFGVSHNFHLATAGPEGADVPPGYEYEFVTVSCPGYLSHQIQYGSSDMKIPLKPVRPLDISGTVLDRQTGAPVAGAMITFGEYHGLKSVSDAAGRFRLEPTEAFYAAYEASTNRLPFMDWVNIFHQNYFARTCHGSSETEVLLEPEP
jgi:hypothetical protein